MKVEGQDEAGRSVPVGQPETVHKSARVGAYASASPAAVGSATDKVSVSRTAALLSEAVRQLGQQGQSASPERLARLREAVQSGNLSVDIRALADKIVADEGVQR